MGIGAKYGGAGGASAPPALSDGCAGGARSTCTF